MEWRTVSPPRDCEDHRNSEEGIGDSGRRGGAQRGRGRGRGGNRGGRGRGSPSSSVADVYAPRGSHESRGRQPTNPDKARYEEEEEEDGGCAAGESSRGGGRGRGESSTGRKGQQNDVRRSRKAPSQKQENSYNSDDVPRNKTYGSPRGPRQNAPSPEKAAAGRGGSNRKPKVTQIIPEPSADEPVSESPIKTTKGVRGGRTRGPSSRTDNQSSSPSQRKSGSEKKSSRGYRQQPNRNTGSSDRNSRRDRKNDSDRKLFYEPFMEEEEVNSGLEAGKLFMGSLRINQRRRTDAYVTVSGMPFDVYVEGVKDRNRALQRDVVAIRLLPLEKWVTKDVVEKRALGDDEDSEMPDEERASRFPDDDTASSMPTPSQYSSVSEATDKLWSPSVDTSKTRQQLFSSPSIEHKSRKSAASGSDDISHLSEVNSKKDSWIDSRENFFDTSEFDVSLVEDKDFKDLPNTVSGVSVSRSNDSVRSLAIVSNICRRNGLQPVGQVVRIVKEKHNRVVVGMLRPKDERISSTINPEDKFARIKPLDHRLPFLMVYVDGLQDELAKGQKAGSQFPLGKVNSALGLSGKIDAETQALLATQDIKEEPFSDEAMQDLEHLGAQKLSEDEADVYWSIPQKEFEKRKDLRDYRIFTIDPTSARDLDDALHIRPLGNDVFEIGVHIADVSYFVREGTKLDQEAAERATSVYLVQRVIPMLPRMLCEQLCSLQPNVERLAFSCIWHMNSDGEIVRDVEPWYGRTIINSCAKLDYSIAQRCIDDEIHEEMVRGTVNEDTDKVPDSIWPFDRRPTGGHSMETVRNDILLLNQIAQKRRGERFQNGAVTLNKVKLAIERDSEGFPQRVFQYPMGASNRLVEEYMLLANYLVAERLILIAQSYAVLRRHPEPLGPQSIEVTESLQELGFPFEWNSTKSLQDSLERIRNNADEKAAELNAEFSKLEGNITGDMLLRGSDVVRAVENMVMRPMKPAEYIVAWFFPAPEWKHYALAIPYYTHFTSPIRRYADILVHRALDETLMDTEDQNFEKRMGSLEDVNEQCAHCNDRKWAAKTASEMCDQIFFCIYLSSHPVETLGVVANVNGSKFFVAVIPEWGLEKKVFVKDLGGIGEFNEERRELAVYPVPEASREEDDEKQLEVAKETEQVFDPPKFLVKELMPFKARLVARLDKIPIDYDVQISFLQAWNGPVFQSHDDDDEVPKDGKSEENEPK